MTSIESTIGACTGNILSTPTPNESLRTVIVLLRATPLVAIITPSKVWILSRLPSETFTLTFTESPAL